MNIHAPKSMTVDEYLAWADGRPERFELVNGMVRQLSPETSGHANAKGLAYIALRAAIKRSGVACYAMPDGMTVRVAATTAFEPDALVYAAPQVDAKSVEIPNPLIIVEVGSPSTRGYDAGFKIKGYMGLPSIHHILLVNADESFIVHHKRSSHSEFSTTTITDGVLHLDPPGLEIPVADFFASD